MTVHGGLQGAEARSYNPNLCTMIIKSFLYPFGLWTNKVHTLPETDIALQSDGPWRQIVQPGRVADGGGGRFDGYTGSSLVSDDRGFFA